MNEAPSVIERAAEFRLHPLGFFYLLDRHLDGNLQRFHVWTAEGEDRHENECHQHSFDIHSVILLGRMRSELFSFVETSGGQEQEFKVLYKNGKSTLLPTGRAGVLEALSTFESSTGNRYFLRAGVIHRVTIVEWPCVTALQTIDRGISIFSYGGNADESPFDRRLVTEAEADEIIRVLEGVPGMSKDRAPASGADFLRGSP